MDEKYTMLLKIEKNAEAISLKLRSNKRKPKNSLTVKRDVFNFGKYLFLIAIRATTTKK